MVVKSLPCVSQEARQVDKNIARWASVVVFKELGVLQAEFDRSELRKLAEQAKAPMALNWELPGAAWLAI